MWKVADEELVAVRVTDDPPALHVARLVLTSATCGRQKQLKGLDHQTFAWNHIKINKWTKITRNHDVKCRITLPLLTKLRCCFPVCDSEDVAPSNTERHTTRYKLTKMKKMRKVRRRRVAFVFNSWELRQWRLPGLGPRGVYPGLSRVRWSLGRKGVVWVSGLASTLGCV